MNGNDVLYLVYCKYKIELFINIRTKLKASSYRIHFLFGFVIIELLY
jgi:hypothetical protein